MGKPQIAAAALAASVVACALFLTLPGNSPYIVSIGGLTLLFILLAYDEGYKTVFQSLAFSAVCGFCIMLISIGVLNFVLLSHEWLPLIWVGATAILWAIDRARVSGREISGPERLPAVPSHRTFIPEFTSPPAPASDLTFSEQAPPEPMPAQPLKPEPLRAPAPVLAKPGKETMIFVNLVGEGLNVLRSVRAEHLGRDFYKIVDSMPEGEKWEYQPGQVVRCKKKNLSNGKGLVATEEAPRA